jgi:RecB family endonuclease NucS
MTDIKLFRFSDNGVAELAGGSVALERSLQVIFERNLESLLGVRFLASEFATNEGGRMDTIGIDENNSPVIIEYKRATNENVINQGLYYLNWLMGRRGVRCAIGLVVAILPVGLRPVPVGSAGLWR